VRRRRRVLRVLIDAGAKVDPRIARILELAAEGAGKVERVDRRQLDNARRGARPSTACMA
jgi:tRNA G18 (ribose-2'-O)-methylase SpoU